MTVAERAAPPSADLALPISGKPSVVRDLLAGFAGQPNVHFLPNPGNGGDALIDVGFFDLAKSLGLGYRVIGADAQLSADDVLILAGGGNLVPEYEHVARALARYAPVVRRLVLLPHSIRGHAEVLASLGANVVLFAREQPSLDYARAAAAGARIEFDHDMAFHADVDALRGRRGMSGFHLSAKNLVRLALVKALKVSARRRHRLSAFRIDREALAGSRGNILNDVSKICSFGTATAAQCYFAASQFIQTIDRFDEVHTDRLHVAIAAGLLGKLTTLYDNSYFKCRAVYQASLSAMGNVTYAGPRQSPREG